eukprot:jgi/Phyca11/101393/e_gw1.5.649.1
MKAWLDPSFFAVAQRHVNSSLAQSAFVSRSDLLKFLQVELWLAFYSVSPSNFYERSNKQYYPPVKSVMPSKRYFAILRAFGKPNAEDDVSSTNWRAPFQHDPNLSHAMDELRRLCSRFGFVSEVSIASLDDDLLRLRSSTVDDLGLTRTRNPKKGYGPVQHGIVSLATGIFLGGHIASKGETVVDVVKILQRGLSPQVTRSELERLTCADLRQKCKDQGVAGYGSKATLIDRILNQDDETTSPRTKSLEAVLIEAWFLKPKSSPEMKTGSKNEDSICSHLPPFFTANSSFTIQQMKSYGLLCR